MHRITVRSLGLMICILFTTAPEPIRAEEAADTAARQAGEMSSLARAAVQASNQENSKPGTLKEAIDELKKAAEDWIKASDGWLKSAQEWAKNHADTAKAASAEDAKTKADDAKTTYDAKRAKVEQLKGSDRATFKSDYVAKHFSLVGGAIVLNPFKIKSVDTDANPATTELELEKGNTDAKVLLEAGFRRRWAWENWSGVDDTLYRELEAIRAQLRAERDKPADKQDVKKIGEWAQREAEIKQEIRKQRLIFSNENEPRAFVAGWDAPPEDECQFKDWRFVAPDGKPAGYCAWNGFLNTAAFLILPDNYAVRLGFALGSDHASGAAGVAGGGDFHIETAVGLDWLRALYPADLEPLRVGFGPELYASFTNDTEQDDMHQRYLAGGALTAGLPLGDTEERLAEVVVRMGWVSVEVPQFIDGSSRLVEVKNRRVDFESKTGFGVDVEMNVPITKEWGYIFLRVTSNSGFNPNPWTTTVGYTIPINNLVETIRQ